LFLWEVGHKADVGFTVDREYGILLFINIKHLTVLEIYSVSIETCSIFNSEHGMLLCVVTSASHRACDSIELMGRFKHKLWRLFTGSDKCTTGRRMHDEISSCLQASVSLALSLLHEG